MRFKRLTIEGYKSFRYSTEILFPASQDSKSIFLIGGMNGAAKPPSWKPLTSACTAPSPT